MRALLGGDERATLEDVLPAFLRTRHWFRADSEHPGEATIVESIALGAGEEPLVLVLASIDTGEGEPDTYAMPLAFVPRDAPHPPQPRAVIATVRLANQSEGTLVDALEHPESCRALLELLARGARVPGVAGELVATLYAKDEPLDARDPRPIGELHANASIQYGDRTLLKVFRRVEDGRSPELEIGCFLATNAPGLTPPVIGAIEYRHGRREPSTIGVLERFVANEGTGWDHALAELGRFFERVLSHHRAEAPPPCDDSLVARSVLEPPPLVVQAIGAYRDAAGLLGRRTAEMHLAFARSTDPAFAPEPYSTFNRRSLYQSLRNLAGRTMRTLRSRVPELPPRALKLARAILDREPELLVRFEPLLHVRLDSLRTRVHGDYHLGQILYTGKDFVLIDFDGGHLNELSERRRKRSPLRDVAGMVRSYHYATHASLLDPTIVLETDRTHAAPWARAWYTWVTAAFLHGYRARALEEPEHASFLPKTDDGLAMLLDRFILARALNELAIELREPGERATVPLEAIATMIGALPI